MDMMGAAVKSSHGGKGLMGVLTFLTEYLAVA
jgi:hypothetical protein